MEIKDFIIVDTASVKEAMEKMDKNARKIIYVVDDQQYLKGVLSDGDIRRWILKDHSIQCKENAKINIYFFLYFQVFIFIQCKKIKT